MCKLNPDYGTWKRARSAGAILIKILKAMLTFVVVIPFVAIWGLFQDLDRFIRTRYARKLEKTAYHQEARALSLRNKADKIKRTTG